MNNKYIPIIIEPHPDELLYSWMIRLAKINELSNRMFFEAYLEEPCVKKRPIQIDIRRGYRNFYKALNTDVDMMELYFQLSTTQFELSFVPTRQQIKVLHNLLRNESELNYISNYFIQEPKMCLECVKEDVDNFGEPYIHRAHQLSGVVACHKHHTPLYRLNKENHNIHDYDFENITDKVSEITKYDCQYAKYAFALLESGFSSNSDILMSIISDKLQETLNIDNISKQQLAHNIANILEKPQKERAILKYNIALSPEETIKVLLYLFENVNDFLTQLPSYEMVIKQHCNICNNDYYISHQAIIDGWGCTYCDDEMDEMKLLKRLVKNIGNDEFILKNIIRTATKRLVLHHKLTDRDLTTKFSVFLFENTKHHCTLTLSKEEAEKRVAKHKHFKLIEYSGVSKPAKIEHDICGQTFEVSTFDIFINNPICRCCETRPSFNLDVFKQQVKDLVGDEYEVLEHLECTVPGIHMVKIRHNKCGKVQTYRTCHFLTGFRCSDCSSLIRKNSIVEMLNEYSNGRYQVKGNNKSKFIILDTKTNTEMSLTPQHILQEILRPTPSLIFDFDRTKERVQITTWDIWYKLCVDYHNEFGHISPKRNEIYKERGIYYWCKTQRALHKKGELSKEQIDKLQDIDFIFDKGGNTI